MDSLLQSSQTGVSTAGRGGVISGEVCRSKMLGLLRHFQEAPAWKVDLPIVVLPEHR